MDLITRAKNNVDKMALFFGSILVFSFGFFSGYFYLIEKNNENEKVVVEEPSDQCLNLIRSETASSNPVKGEGTASPDGSGNSNSASEEKKGTFVASRNSKIFHKSSCPYAQKIKEENRIWFNSEKEAEDKGYSPHAYCFK